MQSVHCVQRGWGYFISFTYLTAPFLPQGQIEFLWGRAQHGLEDTAQRFWPTPFLYVAAN